MRKIKVYPNKKNVILIPVYEKGMLVEVNGAEYRKLVKEFPALKNREVHKSLNAVQRQAMWLVGVKVVQTPEGLYRLF